MVYSYLTPHNEEVVLPTQWQGEAECLIGPFSSKVVAETFLSSVCEFHQYEGFSNRVLAKLDAWFVEIIEA